MFMRLGFPLRRSALVGLAVLLIASCTPTRLHVRRDGADVKEFFVIVDKIDRLETILTEGTMTELGDLTVNLTDNRPYAYAEFQLEERSNADIWRVAHEPLVDWLTFRIIENPSEVRLTLSKSAFKGREDLAIAIIVRADSDSTNQTYFGSLLRPEQLTPKSSLLIFRRGPSIRVVLKDAARPYLDVD